MAEQAWLVHKGPWKCVIVGGDEELAIDMAQIRWNETATWPAEVVEFEAEPLERQKGHPATIVVAGWLYEEERREPDE